MKVLITRPEADAAPIAAQLVAHGHAAVIEPMLAIVARPDAVVDLTGVQALALTSANGARILAERTARRDLRVFAVGDATAAAARAAGFAAVESADGDVDALAHLIETRLAPDDGPLVHPAASRTAGDLKGRLEAAGFEIRRIALYDAVPIRAFSAHTAAALAEGRIDAAVFFSPRTGRTFVRLMEENQLSAVCDRITAVCLSAAVANEIDRLPWRALLIAAQPTQAALLDSLLARDEPSD